MMHEPTTPHVFASYLRGQNHVHARPWFGVNKAAYEALRRPRAVKLLWDKEERAVGFRPSHENSPKVYPVNKTKPQGVHDVAAAAFLKQYGIANDRCRRYAAEMEDGDLLFYLDRDEKKPTEGV